MKINLIEKASIPSTNDCAKELAKDLFPHGTVVMAREQTSGRGRRGRTWLSAPGESLLFSVILRPESPFVPPSVTLTAAAAVALTLEELCFSPKIKWPNDVCLRNKKVCGVLTEMGKDRDLKPFLVMGMGLNVKERSFPKDLEDRATSLSLERDFLERDAEKGPEIPEFYEILSSILNHLEPLYLAFCQGDLGPALEICRRTSFLDGKTVVLEEDGRSLEGTVQGLDEQGRLLVKLEDGSSLALMWGEVHVKL